MNQVMMQLLPALFACAVALTSAAAELGAIADQVVSSPYRFPGHLKNAVIRYRLERADGAAFSLPETSDQRVLRDGQAVVIEICRGCGRERAWGEAELAQYRRAVGLVDSDDARVRAAARGIGAGRSVRTMRDLTSHVRTLMADEVRFDEQLSASEALQRRRGDCGEYAVLLAAFGRARGIPTRVVNGLAYNTRFAGRTHIFGPHVWVQAHIGGRWQSFDAALSVGSTHLALSYGNGELVDFAGDAELRRQLRITAVGVVPD